MLDLHLSDRERVLDLRTAIDLWLGEQIARREELLEEWYQYSTKCLSLELSESGGQALSPSTAPSPQGTISKQPFFAQEQGTCTLTTMSSSSALSRSEPHEHTTDRRAGILDDAGQRILASSSSTASRSKGSIAAPFTPDNTEVATIADAGVSTALGLTSELDDAGRQSVQLQADTENRAASPVVDTAAQHNSHESQSHTAHGSLSQSERDDYCIGSRMAQIQTNPSGVRYGTVRYCGPVAGKEGSWLGIEWDDPLRGKHDGRHEATRYFTCSQPGRVASFIRPPAGPSENLFLGGVTFLDAVEARYAAHTEERGSKGEDLITTRRSRATVADIDIEVPNLDKVVSKVTQLTRLKTVSLTGPLEHRESDLHRGLPPVSSQIEALKTLVGRVGNGPNLEADARVIGDTVPSES